jgi:hypothetical protein
MPDRSKVFWSNAERSTIVRLAVDLMYATPSLTGLPLLRAGIEALPVDRQRKVIALSQAPWFVGMVQDELRRRELEGRVGSDAAEAIREQTDQQLERLNSLKEIQARQEDAIGVLEDCRDGQVEFRAQFNAATSTVTRLLESLIGEVRTLSARLGQVSRPSIHSNAPPSIGDRPRKRPGTGGSSQ